MGILEKITEALHNNEKETVELRRKILKLILDDFNLSNNCFKECFSEELESSWKALSVARKGFAETVKLREEKLNDQEKMVERVWEEVEFERKQIEEKLLGINVKEKELNKIQRWIYQETHAIELKDQELAKKMEEFHVKEDALELKDQELAEKMEDFHVKEVTLMSMKKDLEVKEMGLESVKKGLVIKGSKLDNGRKELRVNENENKLDCVKKELKENENKLVFVKKDVTVQESKLDSVKKELRVNENNLDCVREELKESENKLESVKKDVTVEVSKLDSVKKEVGVNESKLEILNEELREKENDLEAVNKALAVKENRLDVVKILVRAKEGILEMLREKEKKLDYVKRDLNENEYKLESMKKDLTVKESKLDSVKKEVGVNESKLEILKEEVREKENNLEHVNNVVALKENRLDGVNNVLREKESSLYYLEEEFRETQKGLDYVKKDLNENVNNLEVVCQALAVRESRLEILKRELIEKENNLEAANKTLAVKENRLDGVKKALKVQQSNLDYLKKELSVKEKTMDYLKKELREKETNLDSMKKELVVKENMLDSMKKELTLNESNLNVVTKELKEKGKNLDFVKMELRERENELGSVKKEFKAEADDLNALRKQVESEEEILSSTKKKLEHKAKFQDAMKKKLELQEEHLKSFSEKLHLRERELDYTQEAYKQRFEELHSKEKKLDSAEEVTGKSYEGFQSEKRKFLVEQGLFEQRMKDVILREERIKSILEELETREKHFEDRSKELREKEKQLNAIPNAHLKTEPTEDVAVDRVNTIVGNSAVTKFVVIMDGKSLQIFLNEHEKELDLMSDDVFEAIQMSPDPAKLVLDAMEGFYPPHLRKGETEFEASVARRSCILLLEQLIRVSPEIRDFERGIARKIARDWKVKIEATKGNQDEILGFLYLLAAYNLVSSFVAHELIIILEIVAKHDKFAKLCRSLGMKQNLPCFVQNLLTKQQHLEAIRYAYAFELVDQFPPAAILKDYLECVERNYVDVYKKETCSVEEKIEAVERRVASVRAVIRCILDYKLQSQYPVEELEERIEVLTRQKEDQAALSVICEAKMPEQANVNQMGSTNPSILTGTKAPACTLGHSNPMAIILMNMSGKNLQNILNKHLKEHKLLRSEVFSAILMSLDSGMLVLEALEGFYPPEHQKEEIGFHRDIIRQSCILLLEQLMELSPAIKPEAKLEASKLAFAWKAKMMAEMENHLAILGFLLLVGCYRLASAFDKDELESLYHKVAQHVNTSEICHVLGISNNTSRTDDYPSVEESKRDKALGCTDKSICNNMDMKGGQDGICNCASSLHRTSNPALLVLDAFRGCHPVKLVRCENFPSVMRSFSDLLDQLREVSPEIEHHVKMEAIVFAVDWYSKLNGPQRNPTEVTSFLQLLAIYRITDSFHSDGLLGLLEKVRPIERVVTSVKILGLTDKIQYLVQNLRHKKQCLVAFKYVYAFELFDLVSPVSLLKDYVRHSEQIAEQKLHAGNSSHRSHMKAINFEIHALRNTVKQIVDHGLQSEYSPTYLQERIEKLLCQLSNLKQSNSNRDFTAMFQQVRTNKGTCGSAPLAQVQQELTKKRSSPAGGTDVIHRTQQKQNFKRHCHLSMRS